ncbi:hypothetical protein BMR07_16530 [Methylococcaceae bacterium CS1]|nr:hypothetical protein BMR10_14570 [Methylococcaceae bacterium CS4]TXK94848.1 hypothetical protein BMR11_14550 [Methylococcaceae bacterium CS5]TXL02943.1 hypothetical protein BMR07_16530 [Methylococcaceae bacterium CS1]TXL03663.1 hypothetical protein BMR09_14405 [Methylococcaceae bacterium CS3]TXL07694.1 hypothetical protein BMR08_14685 [Methylococcaceae bacterium CS2]
MLSFKGTHFPKDVILYAVFFYVRYGISYRDCLYDTSDPRYFDKGKKKMAENETEKEYFYASDGARTWVLLRFWLLGQH